MVFVGDIEIQGSPFGCEVYDVSKIKVKYSPSGVVGKPVDVESKFMKCVDGVLVRVLVCLSCNLILLIGIHL